MKKLLPILALLSTLLFAQNSTDACDQITEKVSKEALESGRYCSKKYFTELAGKGDINKLKKELQKTICFFADKPDFNSTDFIRSCFNLGNYRENMGLIDPVYFHIWQGNASMVDYLISVTNNLPKKGYIKLPDYYYYAILILANNAAQNTAKTAEIAKMLQDKYGQKISSQDDGNPLYYIIKNGNLETIKFLHEQGINLQGDCEAFKGTCYYGECKSSCKNPIDVAAESSKKIYQYLSEQGYKTMNDLAREQEAAKREQEAIEREAKRKKAEEAKEQIQNAIKANKLEEAIDICKDNISNYYAEVSNANRSIGEDKTLEICYQDLVSKVRKLPKNKIKTVALASLYYNNPQQIMGYIIRDEGKFVWMQDLVSKNVVKIQYSAGYIGECRLKPNGQILFEGHATYLGDVHTIAFGNVPNYQLLWCGK